jgi:hypothetical protein
MTTDKKTPVEGAITCTDKKTSVDGRRGIVTIEDLRQRCRIDDITGCWIWIGAASGPREIPSIYLPTFGRVCGAGVAIGALLNGALPAPGVMHWSKCRTPRCVNPAHYRRGNRSQMMRAVGCTFSATLAPKVALARRQGSRWCDATIEAVRESEGTCKEVGARYGMSPQYVSKLRRGEHRRPLLAPGASVFSLGGGAL